MTLRVTWPGALAAPAQTQQPMRSALAQLLMCDWLTRMTAVIEDSCDRGHFWGSQQPMAAVLAGHADVNACSCTSAMSVQ